MNWLDIVNPLEAGKDGKEPIYIQLINRLAQSIQSGALPESTQLPTNRALASLLKIDRSTVSRAYMELANAGLIESHVGRGTFVRRRAAREAGAHHLLPVDGGFATGRDKSLGASSEQRTETSGVVDWSSKFSRASAITVDFLSRQPAPQADRDLISFSGGSPASDSFPHDDLNQVLHNLLVSPRARDMFDYSPAEGDALLRQEVRKYLLKQNIAPQDDELMILSGSQQGIELVASSFIDHGDNVVVEAPTYFWALCNFKARQARFSTVPLDQEGMRLDQLATILSQVDAKLIYTMPDFQNPSGVSLSLARRKELIEMASQFGVPIFEDNFAGELRLEGDPLPPLRSLPGAQKVVIHQGTFSKALCPGLRIGWLVAPPDVIARLAMAKRASDLSTNSMAQVVLANYLNNGLYAGHLEKVKTLYRSRRDAMIQSLKWHLGGLFLSPEYFGATATDAEPNERRVSFDLPAGGLFVWAKLPGKLSSRALLKLAEHEGVTFSPGDMFFASVQESEYFRLCFIQNNEVEIDQGIERLARAIATLFERSERLRRPRKDVSYRGSDNVLV